MASSTMFTCTLCSAQFATLASVISHVRSEHNVQVEEAIRAVVKLPKVLVATECKLCSSDNTFDTEAALIDHLRIHHNVKKPKASLMRRACRLCRFAAAKSADEMDEHIRTQHQIDDFAEDDDDEDENVGDLANSAPPLAVPTTTKPASGPVPLAASARWRELYQSVETPNVEAQVEAIMEQQKADMAKSASSPSEAEKSSSESESSASDSSHSLRKAKKKLKRKAAKKLAAKLQEKKRARKKKRAKARAKKQMRKKQIKSESSSSSSSEDTEEPLDEPKKKKRKTIELKPEVDEDVEIDEAKELIRFSLPQKPVTKGFVPIASAPKDVHDDAVQKARVLLDNSEEDAKNKVVNEVNNAKELGDEVKSSFVPSLTTPVVPSLPELRKTRNDESVTRRHSSSDTAEKEREPSVEISSEKEADNNNSIKDVKERGDDRRSRERDLDRGSERSYDRMSEKRNMDRWRGDYDNERRNRDGSYTSSQRYDREKVNMGGLACELCNVRMDNAESAYNHFSGRRHQERIRHKIRCFLCAKFVDNAKRHLEENHANDVFQCNMKSGCTRPKFLDLAKVIGHMTTYHDREIRNLSNEELIARRMIICADNLHSYRCCFCSAQFVGQPLSSVVQHQRCEDGVQRPSPRDVQYHCRFCGNARFFEDDEALQEHIERHRANIRELRDNLDSQDEGRKSTSFSPTRRQRSRSNSRDRGRKYDAPPSRRSSSRRSPSPRSPRSRSPRSRSPRSRSIRTRSRSASPQPLPLLLCPYCGDALDREETSLRSHIEKHHMDESFQCLLCDEGEKWAFFDYKQVSHHIRNVHREKSRDMDEREIKDHCVWPKQLMGFKCMQCLDSFYGPPDLVEKHFEVAHNGKVKHFMEHVHFFCRICVEDLPMEDVQELEEHLAKEHKPSGGEA